jgi:hypothetical protein
MDNKYVAGLFDGEGYITISRYKRPETGTMHYSPQIGISMCWKPTLEEMKEQFGGSLRKHKLLKGKTIWRWVIYNGQAKNFLEVILPELREKRSQAVLIMDYYINLESRGKSKIRLSESEVGTREKYYRDLKGLKKMEWV